MRLEWIRPEQADSRPEKWAVFLFAAAVLAFWIMPVSLYECLVCPFHELTGYPCPSCGMTRCAFNLAKGEWGRAFRVSPLFFLFYGGAAQGWMYAVASLLFGLPRLRIRWRRAGELIWTARGLGLVVVVYWACLIAGQVTG